MSEVCQDVNETPKSRKGLSTIRAASSLVMTAIGLGILTLPRAFAQSGWLGGFISLFLSCGVSGYCSLVLWRALFLDPQDRDRPVGSIEELAMIALGPVGKVIVGVIYHLLLIGVCSMLLVVMAEAFFVMSGVLNKRVWVALCGTMNIPLSWIRHMKDVGLAAAIGVFSVTVTTLMIIICCSDEISTQDVKPDSQLLPKATLVLLYSFNNFLLSFTVGVTEPLIVAGMRSPRDFPKALIMAFTFIFAVYVAVSVLGYVAYGKTLNVVDSVVQAICPPGEPLTVTGWILNFILIVLTAIHLLLLMMPTAQLLDSFFEGCESRGRVLNVTLVIVPRTLLVCLISLIGVAVPRVDILVKFMAAAFIVPITILLPLLTYGRLTSLNGIKQNPFQLIIHFCLACIGVFAVGFGIYGAIVTTNI